MAHLLLKLEALPLVLVLELVLLHLHSLEAFNAALDLDRKVLDVAGAAAKEACELSLDETKHGRVHRRRELLVVVLSGLGIF